MRRDFLNFTGLSRKFSREEDGATALTFAVGLTVMLMGVGAGVDFAAASKADLKAQDIADTSAIAAAAFMRTNDNMSPENADFGLKDGHTYKASELGYKFQNFVVGGADGVSVTVEYHDDHAIATVTGATRPSVMGLFGQKTLTFAASSRVEFASNVISNPASVYLVLDNSGSMAWDDGTGTGRLDGLKTSVNGLLRLLRPAVANIRNGEQRPLRMGMIPFTAFCEAHGDACAGVNEQGVVTEHIAPERFGLITAQEVERMIPRVSTDPVASLRLAEDWMEDEVQVHRNELQSTSSRNINPQDFEVLRYVVLMSDGQNSRAVVDCEERTLPNTGWRLAVREDEVSYWEYVQFRTVEYDLTDNTPSQRNLSGFEEAQWRVAAHWNSEERVRHFVDEEWRTLPLDYSVSERMNYENRKSEYDYIYTGDDLLGDDTGSTTDGGWGGHDDRDSRDRGRDGHSRDRDRDRNDDPNVPDRSRELSLLPDFWPGYHDQVDADKSGHTPTPTSSPEPIRSQFFREDDNGRPYYTTCGSLNNNTVNTDMLNTCQAMRDSGIEVITIGYGLTPGLYETNWDGGKRSRLTSENAVTAEANLRQCAGSEENYFEAENAETLEEVFNEIGQSILDESMYLSR